MSASHPAPFRFEIAGAGRLDPNTAFRKTDGAEKFHPLRETVTMDFTQILNSDLKKGLGAMGGKTAK
jgi:hypothetical protein